MSVFADQAIFQLIGNVTRGSGVTALASLPNGAIAVVNESNVVETGSLASTATKKVRIVQKGMDGAIYQSPWFSYDQIVAKNRTNYTQATEQVSFLGSDGTTITGLGTVTVGNDYMVRITLGHSAPELNNSPMIKEIAFKASDTTQQTLAKGLMTSALNVVNRSMPAPQIRTERIATGGTNTQAAFTGTGTILKFTKGSKTVEAYIKAAAGTTALTASTMTAAVGDLLSAPSSAGRSFTFDAVALGTGAGRHVIYIGTTAYDVADAGTNANNATAIAAAINAGNQATASVSTATVTVVYNKSTVALPPLVLSSDDDSTFANVAVTIASGEATSVKYVAATAVTTGASFNLDLPWQGETGYVYQSTTLATTTGKYTIGTTPVWGLKFTGLAQPFSAINGKYQKVSFEISPVTNTYALINQYTGAPYATNAYFDAGIVTAKKQVATEGTGTGEQIAEMEILTQFQNKDIAIQAFPATKYTQEAVVANGYDIISLTLKEELNTNMIGANAKTFASINIAVKSDLDTNDSDVLGTVFVVSA